MSPGIPTYNGKGVGVLMLAGTGSQQQMSTIRGRIARSLHSILLTKVLPWGYDCASRTNWESRSIGTDPYRLRRDVQKCYSEYSHKRNSIGDSKAIK